MDTKKTPTQESAPNISWTAPEFEYQEKSAAWYWISIIIASVILLFALWQKNLLFGFFIVIAELMVLHMARQQPQHIHFTVTGEGITIGDIERYPYEELSGFHISEGSMLSHLVLKTKRRLKPYIKILSFPQDTEMIKSILSARLQEIDYKEPASNSISKMIGF